MLSSVLIYSLVGIVSGIIAGLFGVGGGLILVPILIYLFQQQQFSPDILVHMAIGTSLAVIVLNASMSTWSHHQHQGVLWQVVKRLGLGLFTGALLGAVLADYLSATWLKQFFAVFEISIGLYLFADIKPKPQGQLPSASVLLAVGHVIGFISALIGIGGGTMTSPFLIWRQVQVQQAIGTAAACGLPIAVAGSIGFILTGYKQTDLPNLSWGYVYLPALFGIAVFGVIGSYVGALWAHRLPAHHLKRGFALFLCLAGINLLLFV